MLFMDYPALHSLIVPLIERAYSEDEAFNDITSKGCIPEDLNGCGQLILKKDGVIAGLPWLPLIFQMRDATIHFQAQVEEGQFCPKGTVLGTAIGKARSLLSAERTALNFLQHLSGIATLTAKCVALVKGTNCQILDTRKTLPGYRALQKYAVHIGGGTNHRLGLADLILIKNNHLTLTPSMAHAVAQAKQAYPGVRIEVEVGSFAQLTEALHCGVDVVMLDNMAPQEVQKCVEFAKGRVFLEASGGITFTNMADYAKTGVNAISIGALTHSAPALDIAFRIQPR